MENLKTILDSIKEHTTREWYQSIPNKSIARGQVTMKSGKNEIVWIVNREYAGFGDSVLRPDGERVTSKNSRWGQILTSKFKGTDYCFGHDVRNKPVRLDFTITSSASYINTPILDNLKIGLSSEQTWSHFKNIEEAYKAFHAGIEKLREIQRQEQLAREAIEKAKEEQKRKEQEEELAKLEAKKNEVNKELVDLLENYKNACSFIRRQASLRYNPVIDTIQSSVKFSHVYDGKCVVIDGGPGTGKTTTLIQRLKYLISRLDLEDNMLNNPDIKITPAQFEIIMKNDGDWLFFSPTELLRLYLRDAMNEEGLVDTDNRTAVWSKHLRKILRDNYYLIGSEYPFSGSSEIKPLFLDNEMRIIRDFNEYFVSQITSEIKRLISVDYSGYEWRGIGESVTKYAKRLDTANDLESLLRVLVSFRLVRGTMLGGANEVELLMDRYRRRIADLADGVMVKISEDKTLYSELRSLVVKGQQVELEDDEDEEEEALDSFAEDKLQIARRLRAVLRAASVNSVDATYKLSGLNKDFFDKISSLVKPEELNSIGSLALFDKRFRPLLVQADRFVFNRLPRLYKTYRKEQLKADNTSWDQEILANEVSGEKRNRPLHPQEQALLLGVINGIARKFYQINPDYFKSLSHKYTIAFRDVCKPVIGIDEATDYSLVDYYAMSSLRHYQVSSCTLAGDIMQGLTVNGIRNWSDLSDDLFFPDGMEVFNLKTSYRQSPSLLSLAQQLYKEQMGVPAPYSSYLEGTKEDVPKPLWFESDDEDEKAEWLIKRILEVKSKYGFVPSIAVFVAEPSEAGEFADRLLSFDTLQDEGIDVEDCSRGNTISNKDTIRIFPISLVKGMEFEVAFFHNIDHLQSQLVERYLYVGLSRAAFFLGVTSEGDSNVLQGVRGLFSSGNWRTI